MNNRKRLIKYILGVLFTIIIGGCNKPDTKVDLTLVTEPIFIAEGVRSVWVTKQEQDVLRITYQPHDYEASFEYWKMDIPYNNEVVVNTEEMLKLYQQLVILDVEKTPLTGETKTNLDNPLGKIRVEFCQTTKDERAAALMGQAIDREASPSYQRTADSTATLLIGANDGQGNYYVAYEGAKEQVFLLSERLVNAVLDIRPFDYIIKVSAVADIETVKNVTINSGGETYKLSEKQLSEQQYRLLYNDLLSVFVVEEIAGMSQVDSEAILEFKFKRNVKDAPDLHITYHAWDEERYAVSVNGETFFLVDSSEVEALKTKIEETFA